MKRTSSPLCVQVETTVFPHRPPKWFDYMPPDTDDSHLPLQIGQIVEVPFGRQQSTGIIRALDIISTTPAGKLKTIDRVLQAQPLPSHLLSLADWVGRYYQANPRAVWQTILPSGLTAKARPRKTTLQPLTPRVRAASQLNAEQSKLLQAILDDPSKPHLIHGITGSGKTQIYEALIDETLAAGASALVLAPEIILTRHLAERLRQRFGARLVVAHSGMTQAQRRNIWIDCLHSTEPKLYLGPRSTLFLPFHKLGLIVVDEEHDSSYKQEQSPRYQTTHVAAQLHRLTGAMLVFGSATPSLTTLALAHHGNVGLLRMHERYGEAQLPDIDLVEHRYRDGIFSKSLIQALIQTITHGNQAIILLNRRGSARRLSCDDCGESIRCTHCDTPLVLHADIGRLRCHVCGRDSFPPTACPACKSAEIHYHGIGSKRAVEELERLLPRAKVGRLDRDIESQEAARTIEAMQEGSIDILLGTQMIAKGLDFPNVTLVGILNTDDLIAGNDWMSAERAVSLIMQAAGRAGRAKQAGRVIIQTHRPERPVFAYVKKHDWDGFASEELKQRQKFGYPPYRWLLRLSIRQTHSATAEKKAMELASSILAGDPKQARYEVLGPAAPLLARTGKWFVMQLIIKAHLRKDLVELASRLDSDWTIDLDPAQVI